jgi:hypothetical protein
VSGEVASGETLETPTIDGSPFMRTATAGIVADRDRRHTATSVCRDRSAEQYSLLDE